MVARASFDRFSYDGRYPFAGDTAGPNLTTRIPPEQMHSVSFKAVLGKRPIALLVSTPQLCRSRVCGPVTDIAATVRGSRVPRPVITGRGCGSQEPSARQRHREDRADSASDCPW